LGVWASRSAPGLRRCATPAGSGDVAHILFGLARRRNRRPAVRGASSDRHTVKALASIRTTVSGTIVDLRRRAFAGRRARDHRHRVPTADARFRHNEHVVAVTELPIDARPPAAGQGASKRSTATTFVRWSDANLNYVAVSDMDEKALGEFVEVFGVAADPRPNQPGPDAPGARGVRIESSSARSKERGAPTFPWDLPSP